MDFFRIRDSAVWRRRQTNPSRRKLSTMSTCESVYFHHRH